MTCTLDRLGHATCTSSATSSNHIVYVVHVHVHDSNGVLYYVVQVHVPYSYGWSIIALTALVKLVTLPLTKTQVRCCTMMSMYMTIV